MKVFGAPAAPRAISAELFTSSLAFGRGLRPFLFFGAELFMAFYPALVRPSTARSLGGKHQEIVRIAGLL